MLQTVFRALGTPSPPLVYCTTGRLSVLPPFTFLTQSPHPPPVASVGVFSVSVSLFLLRFICSLVLGLFGSTCK